MTDPKITIDGRSYDRFIHYPHEVKDGTFRCIRCGQIDEDVIHDDRLCQAIPKMAISIMQPWAWLIVNRHKPIENRDWATKYRGSVAIHAGKRVDDDCVYSLTCHDGPRHPVTGRPYAIDTGQRLVASNSQWDTWSPPAWAGLTGGIVGVADIVDCVTASDSEWFVGKYGFVLANQRPVDFIPCKGALGFFDWRSKLEPVDVKTA